jgi:transcription elongation factor SPT6
LAALQRELVNAVADAGVELNMCIEHQHLQQQLAFVPGMGLRKADNLRQNMKRALPTAIARKQLLEKGLLKPCVYKNAAGFLKIEDVSESTTRVSPLEATRIHPEQYDEERIVQRMCANAEGEENNDETRALQFVDAVQKRSRKAIKQRCKEFDHERWIEIWRQGERPSVQNFDVLRQTDTGEDYRDTGELMDTLVSLDLDDYDRILIAGGAPRSQIKRLNFIKEELRFPYLDMRRPLREPEPDEMFTLVTGETDSSLHVGLRVSATVTSIPDDYKAQVRLEGGLNGQIDISEISDNNEHHVVASALSEGQQVRAVVIKVDKYRMRVDLSMKKSYVDKPECWWVQNRHGNMYMEDWCRATNRLRFDQFFDENRAVDELFKLQADEEDRARMAAQGSVSITKAGQAMNTLARRQIYHPAFMNIDHMEAENHLLKKCDVGECIIRPGNKGANYLSISWYFQPDMIRHVEVREEDMDGEFGLGRKLFVRGIADPYIDLDDLIANYVGAMNDHVSTMLDFKYFRQGAMATTLDAMSAMKKAAPKKVPFYVVLDAKQPGYFLLTWCIDINKPFGREYIALHPGGFKFRDQIYEGPRGPIVIFTDWLKKKMSKRGAPTPGGGVAPVVAAPAAAPRRSRFAAATPLTDSATTSTPYSAAPTPLSTGGGGRSGRSRFSAA